MNDHLKNSEIFCFLAFIFLFLFVISEQQKYIQAGEQNKDISQLEKPLEDSSPSPSGTTVIELAETNKAHRFEVGSATLTEDFQKALKTEVIPFLKRKAENCGCDTIEIIGHTDSLYIGSSSSNLDQKLVEAFNGNGNSSDQDDLLIAGSNLDLGMMRALSIVRFLKQAQKDGLLPQKHEAGYIKYFIPYSAGQMVLNNYELETNPNSLENQNRRRIEIRLLQSSTWQKQK